MVLLRTLTLKPGSVPKFFDSFNASEDYAGSALAGLWRTEVGVLNQIIQIWDMKSIDAFQKSPIIALEEVLHEEVKILSPLPFSPPLLPGRFGRIYEMRTYTYRGADNESLIRAWEQKIGERRKLSPFIGAWSRIMKDQIEWVHIWAYEDAAVRQDIREKAQSLGLWPPQRHPSVVLLKQENCLLVPAESSKLR
jgi:hypothetical protein